MSASRRIISITATSITLILVAGGAQCQQGGVDLDADGISDVADNCMLAPNSAQTDGDGDGVGDACDNCLALANADQADVNENGIGDACEPLGIWEMQSGKFFFEPYKNFTTRYLVVNPDGTGRILQRQESTLTAACMDIFHFLDASSIAIDDSTLGGGKTQILLYSLLDSDTLQLTESNGRVSLFARRSSVPPELECKTFTIEQRIDDIAVWPYYYSGLAYDGTSLWFSKTNPDQPVPLNPLTGVLGTPITLANGAKFVHAIQGTDFWGLCFCGIDWIIERRTTANVLVDSINTDTELGIKIYIQAAAYDNTNNFLWLHGPTFSDGIGRLLKVNSNVQPPVLASSSAFDIFVRSMTWDGTHLWVCFRNQIDFVVRIDPTTLKAIETYRSPDRSVFLQGIAAVNGSIYIIARESPDKGVLFRLSP